VTENRGQSGFKRDGKAGPGNFPHEGKVDPNTNNDAAVREPRNVTPKRSAFVSAWGRGTFRCKNIRRKKKRAGQAEPGLTERKKLGWKTHLCAARAKGEKVWARDLMGGLGSQTQQAARYKRVRSRGLTRLKGSEFGP